MHMKTSDDKSLALTTFSLMANTGTNHPVACVQAISNMLASQIVCLSDFLSDCFHKSPLLQGSFAKSLFPQFLGGNDKSGVGRVQKLDFHRMVFSLPPTAWNGKCTHEINRCHVFHPMLKLMTSLKMLPFHVWKNLNGVHSKKVACLCNPKH